MRTEEFHVATIENAAKEILYFLKKEDFRSVSSRHNVFYFNGWDGLGASAVLRAIAERLTPTSPAGKRDLAEHEFDQLIHIDCSMWESRRALQKAVAEQLKLPDQVMELFYRQDEEDDFKGVPQGSRTELPEVLKVMYQHVQNKNNGFLVIFHNGSSEEIDLASLCGFRLSGFATNKVLWTFQGRFRHKPKVKVDMAINSAGTTDAFLLANSSYVPTKDQSKDLWSYLASQEASELVTAHKIITRPYSTFDQPAQVDECFLYMLELCCRSSHSVDYDLTTHIASYWVCDGIIPQLHPRQRDDISDDGDNTRLWRAAEALQREMQLDVDYHQYSPSTPLAKFVKSRPYWTSPTCGFTWIPAGAIPKRDMFQSYSDKLHVLKLSGCTFDFQSPPFICCHGLRFLWFDHCQGTGTSTDGGAEKEEDVHWCFQRLWVLDVRYTNCDQILSAQMLGLMTQLRELSVIGAEDWDMGQLQGRLPNIRKLRVKDSKVICSCSENDLFSEMNKLELLDFSGNWDDISPITSLSGKMVRCLETVIINNGYKLQQIYFRGCPKLKNLLLRGPMMNVRSLDISSTAVKILDISTTNIPDELYLLGCEKLCAIMWPSKDKMKQEGLSKLCIDTTQPVPTSQPSKEKAERGTTSTTGTSVLYGSQLIDEFPWYISVRDARLLGSLEAVCSYSRKMYVEVSSVAHPTTADGGCKYEGIKSPNNSEQQVMVSLHPQIVPVIYEADIIVDYLKQTSKGNGDASRFMSMWPCPDVPDLPSERGYIYIQDKTRTELLWTRGEEGNNTMVVPKLVPENARILHVHDALSITSIPLCPDTNWRYLEWCRVERCPTMKHVFTHDYNFSVQYKLGTFWASHLMKARCIFANRYGALFSNLTYLHVDCCPRLIHVLPFLVTMTYPNCFSQLRTLEIMWCGDLEEVLLFSTLAFPEWEQELVILEFTSLKHIHLHELPRLRSICGIKMSAPNLETVKIRGCWSLKRLPDVGSGSKVVECDCEKEWWDRLEWDNGSQASRYKPIHSRYYKKTMLRGSVLR